jgi:branched-chain amino acid transport system permease protein
MAPVLVLRGLLIVGALVGLAAPWLFDLNQLTLMTDVFTVLVMALMWNLLAGYADIITVGQQAFVGVGAYAFYGLTVLAEIDPFVAVGLAGLVTLVLAVPAMAFVFRLRTAYLAVGTWVVAEVLMLIAGKLPGFGSGSGVSLPIRIVKAFGSSLAARTQNIYFLAFGLADIAFVATWALLRSRVGLGLTAMRDNEEAAGSAGVDLVRGRILCFLWTAPFLGLAGVLVTLQKLRVSPGASFSITDWTIYIIFIVVIGGIGSLEGPFLGTILFFVMRQYLSDFGAWYLMLLGAISIAIILIEPRGLWGLWRRFNTREAIPVSHHPPVV